MADDWIRLGAMVRERREDLGLTQADVQNLDGPSPASLRMIENGRAQTMIRNKRRKLEAALKWRPGSIDDILAGGDPAPSSESVRIPHIRQFSEAGNKKYELTARLGKAPEPLKLVGLTLLSNALAGAADDATNGESPDRLIKLAHKTHHAAMEILADAMSVDVSEAHEIAMRFGYLFDDEALGVEDNPRT